MPAKTNEGGWRSVNNLNSTIMEKWNEFSEIVADVYEIVEQWSEEYFYGFNDVGSGYGTMVGCIETSTTSIYFEDLVELKRRLKKLGVKIEMIENAGVDDEGLIIWLGPL